MSGNTEFQRAVSRFRLYKERTLQWIRKYLLPLFKLRVIRGVIIGAHHGPLRGAKVTLNGWRTVQSDQRGRFVFLFVFRRVNHLTVEWREAELIDWITIDATRQRVSTLKLKWPLLVRGQVIDPDGEPMSQVPVALNQKMITETDAHGTFIFPLEEESTEASDQLVFKLGTHSFVHHFKANPQEHLLHRFMLSERDGLFHIEDRASAQANASRVNGFTERLRLVFWSTVTVIIIAIIANILVTQNYRSKIPMVLTEANKRSELLNTTKDQSKLHPWESAGVLERANHNRSNQSEGSADQSLPWSAEDSSVESVQGDKNRENEEAIDLEQAECHGFEFTYINYYVPRGMEGILLSLVFGRWQPWRDGLSTFNGLDRHHELQAGQRVKIKLPLSSWTLYKHQGVESWDALLKLARCSDEDDERLCLNLIQAWNPHVVIRRLRAKDQLLINLKLLQKRPFEGATRGRIEKLRRGGGPRRKRPRIKLARACEVPILKLSEVIDE